MKVTRSHFDNVLVERRSGRGIKPHTYTPLVRQKDLDFKSLTVVRGKILQFAYTNKGFTGPELRVQFGYVDDSSWRSTVLSLEEKGFLRRDGFVGRSQKWVITPEALKGLGLEPRS